MIKLFALLIHEFLYIYIVKAIEIIENDEESMVSNSEEFKKNESKKKSIFSTKSGLFPTSKLFGICNFDIIPIILGN